MRGGIGGGPPSPHRDFAAEDAEAAAAELPAPGRMIPSALAQHEARELLELRNTVMELETKSGEQQARIDELSADLVRSEGEAGQWRNALLAHDTAIRTLDARLTAIAQQVVRNSRRDALEAASKTRQPGERPEHVEAMATRFEAWLNRPFPQPEPPAQNDGEDQMELPHHGPHSTSHH